MSALQNFSSSKDFLESDEARRISTKNEYLFGYSNFYTYHPFHAMSMIAGGSVPFKWCSKIYMVGAQKPGIARTIGYTTMNKFDDALKDARRYVGNNPRILCTPECYSGGMPVNVTCPRVEE